ncbi:DNA repair protein RecO [Arsenophonus endosymbiont of Aleurodicus floccissimus]|nr:DNA repair protein RecO [Arsenophonus endosymbiont of Aleurodicus floccissimus]
MVGNVHLYFILSLIVSLLLDFFTENEGRIRLLAKGARSRRSNLKGGLQPFTPLLIRWGGKIEMKTLCGAELISLALPFTGTVLYSGLYVNELLARVLDQNIPYQTLFFEYLACLQIFAGSEYTPEHALRRFELSLLSHLGYGIDFLHCAGSSEPVADSMTYRYRKEKGFIASLIIDHLSFTGKQLKAFADRQFLDVDTFKSSQAYCAKALFRGKYIKKP